MFSAAHLARHEPSDQQRGTAELHAALLSHDKGFLYPPDPYLVELYKIALTPQLTRTAFLKLAAERANCSLRDLASARELPCHDLHPKARYAYAAAEAGPKGIEDEIRFLRWQYFTSDNDDAGLHVTDFRETMHREIWAARILDTLWICDLGQPRQMRLQMVLRSLLTSADDELQRGRAVAEKLTAWLGIGQFKFLVRGPFTILETSLADDWQWPHRGKKWELDHG